MTEYAKIKGLFFSDPIPERYFFLTSGKGDSVCERTLSKFSEISEFYLNPEHIYEESFKNSIEQKLLLPLEFLS